jgi:hypothetical protein
MGRVKKRLTIAGSQGKMETEVLLDSRAGVSAVRKDVAKRITIINVLPETRRFGLGDGKNSIQTNLTCNFIIYMKGKTPDGKFYIVDNLVYPVIVGSDFMQTWDIVLYPKKEDFEIKGDPKNIPLVLVC